MMASTFPGSRPSLKLGTHSTTVCMNSIYHQFAGGISRRDRPLATSRVARSPRGRPPAYLRELIIRPRLTVITQWFQAK